MIGSLSRCFCTWNENSQDSKDADRSPMLAFKGVPAEHDTQTCCLGPTLNYVSIRDFFMGSILWLYQTQELLIIFVSVTDVSKYP